jgi:hypothetical protein
MTYWEGELERLDRDPEACLDRVIGELEARAMHEHWKQAISGSHAQREIYQEQADFYEGLVLLLKAARKGLKQ